MRTVSDLISDSKKSEPGGAFVLAGFVVFVVAVLGVPVAMVWAASSMGGF
jgi:hypothetical protein